MLFSRPNDEYSEKMKSETKCICPYEVCDETCLCHAGSRPFFILIPLLRRLLYVTFHHRHFMHLSRKNDAIFGKKIAKFLS